MRPLLRRPAILASLLLAGGCAMPDATFDGHPDAAAVDDVVSEQPVHDAASEDVSAADSHDEDADKTEAAPDVPPDLPADVTCDQQCPTPFNSVATCVGGSCSFECLNGFADCNKNAQDGCEVATANDDSNCGSCGFECVLPHAVPSCSSGKCGIAQCDPGYADCDNNLANGCEVTLATDANHCGSCTKSCPLASNASAACVASACTFVCNSNWVDCDGNPGNGCEAPKKDYPGTVLADAPVAYWRLGESTGSTAKDATGHGHDGSYVGPLAPQQGAIACDPDKAASFAPSKNTFIQVPRDAALEPASSLTIEYWFKQTGTPSKYQKMFWYGPAGADKSWGFLRQNLDPGKWVFFTSSGNPQWLEVTNVAADVWYHLVLSYDGSMMRAYLNGTQAASRAETGNLDYDHIQGLIIGSAGPYFDLFEGVIDEFAIYDKALTSARILAHYEAGRP